MKTFEEILEIVEKEISLNEHRKNYAQVYEVKADAFTVEGIHEQRERAVDDKVFPIFWMETVPAPEGALCDGLSINRQYFNNKKEMIPVENKE